MGRGKGGDGVGEARWDKECGVGCGQGMGWESGANGGGGTRDGGRGEEKGNDYVIPFLAMREDLLTVPVSKMGQLLGTGVH